GGSLPRRLSRRGQILAARRAHRPRRGRPQPDLRLPAARKLYGRSGMMKKKRKAPLLPLMVFAAALLAARPGFGQEAPARAGSATAAAETAVGQHADAEQPVIKAQAPGPESAAPEESLQADITEAVRFSKRENKSRFITLNSENDLY